MKKQDRWWYRLVQVVFCLFVIISIGIGVASIIASIPELNTYSSGYRLKCADGTLRGNFTGAELNYSNTDIDDDSGRAMARFACSNPTLTSDEFYTAYAKYQAETKIHSFSKNYEIVLERKEYYGTWWDVLIAVVVSIVSIPLITSLVRAVFLYVAFEEPFKENMLVLKKYLAR
ncbi:MAG: hypothetical protein A3J09_00295 [Candidatus Zambryskibacteria bacterium RIFCSPLOWO2_02_FULL_51_21]|uniref:Uncharacterized protein n=1 Tax=Candidatus Zambryskibacteria bacterium RIFCSPHIGHO2_02_FULL_43_37 TaxID=1802749 RepID=A0A1G2THW7_9BACT|nr:MAG: hypothetical protein A2723_00295 [Candidatus Zambryskibacteria bacterium RIFCSPHIGHO2_01_FULL_52_18]OHA96895.1 MAG: hypothetical protein A3D49_02195 [Candidatus Zambryskibacteria bacterium RIFCSPHIGHO2_02_FULL_43_37]OHB07048.1 MAG: hypothetical protein A2944_02160 [Candidatus Zambryskibacteria bacterium RIFCSPLOWO2_01_FULL_52_12]OHB11007.1 MAG: hypothetical protein A3J09_00295 [Candidatus Zambryskibacteria bacterium RIFCSPLOWO2_02_FULL_51_21]